MNSAGVVERLDVATGKWQIDHLSNIRPGEVVRDGLFHRAESRPVRMTEPVKDEQGRLWATWEFADTPGVCDDKGV